MATKREAKKKIKNEYRKLREDVQNYISKGKDVAKDKADALLVTIDSSEKSFVEEINKAEKDTKGYFKDLFGRAVDQIDKDYQELKKLISK
jgi:gas vesicle protein